LGINEQSGAISFNLGEDYKVE